MRIVIDARQITDHFPGIARYSYHLLRAMALIDHGYELVALVNPQQPTSRYDLASIGIERYPIRATPFSLAEQIEIPQVVRRLRADGLHALYYVRPFWGLPCPSVTTLYDLIPRFVTIGYPWRTRLLFDLLQRLAIRASRRLIVISEATRTDLLAAYGVARDRVDLAYAAVDSFFQPATPTQIAALRQRLHLPPRYVLSLASNKAHKNVAGLLQAWVLLEQHMPDLPPLLLAGHREPGSPDPLQQARAYGLRGQIRDLGAVAEADMPALYSGAALFVFPSLYEGFGMPILEAMACGAAVVCGQRSSIPEVAGAAGLCTDVADPQALATSIAMVVRDPARLEQMRHASLIQAQRFTWASTATATLASYRRAFGPPMPQ
ncbi:MAG: glycosyltransferase family 1 protein [Roseiflexaceae bacterium]